MSTNIAIDPQRAALLVMDLQADILAMLGADSAAIVDAATAAIAAARAAAIPVIYVVVGFRPGYPEANPNNQSFAMLAGTGRFTGAPGADIAPAIAPHAGDVVICKHRVSAFHATDLDMILRAKRIDTIAMLGLATSGVVLSSLRWASDADYRCVVVADACADRDPEVHRVLVEKVFPRQAQIATVADFAAAIASAATSAPGARA